MSGVIKSITNIKGDKEVYPDPIESHTKGDESKFRSMEKELRALQLLYFVNTTTVKMIVWFLNSFLSKVLAKYEIDLDYISDTDIQNCIDADEEGLAAALYAVQNECTLDVAKEIISSGFVGRTNSVVQEVKEKSPAPKQSAPPAPVPVKVSLPVSLPVSVPEIVPEPVPVSVALPVAIPISEPKAQTDILNESQYAKVKAMLLKGEYIKAIRDVRSWAEISILESKNYVDAIMKSTS